MKTATKQDAMTRAQGWALGLAAVASFMVVLDLQVVATALTTIRRDLGASAGQLDWVINAYTLAFAVLLLTAAALGDRLGRRRVFVTGLAIFAIGSVACALAPGAGALIAARTVQGTGAAAVMPSALALLNAAVPPQRRGWAMGIFGSVSALAVVVGPVLGGAITQAIAWPWIFWLNVPIAAGAIALALRHLPESYGPRASLDLPGVALSTGAALGLVWGLMQGGSDGWTSPQIAGALAGGAVLTVAFVGWERRARAPMLPLRLFGLRGFSAGNAVAFLLTGSVTGAVFFMAQFLQAGLGADPLGAGLRLLPWGVAPALIAPQAGKLADRIGDRPLIVSGLLLQAAGLAWIAAVASPGLAYPVLIAPLVISGAGIGLAIPAATRAVVGAVPRDDIGKASGSFSMMRQLGGAFGVAILAAVFAAAGGYGSPAAFSAGFRAALAAAAGLSVAAVLAGLALPGRPVPEQPAPAEPLVAVRQLSQAPAHGGVGKTAGRSGGQPHSAGPSGARTVFAGTTERSEGMMAADRQAEIAASAAALQDLGPGYDQALAEGLVERIGAEIDQRIAAEIGNRVSAEVDSRIPAQLDQYTGCRHQRRQARRLIRAGQDHSGRQAALLTIGSMLVALLVTIVTLHGSPGTAAITLTALIWVIVGIINLAYALRRSPRP